MMRTIDKGLHNCIPSECHLYDLEDGLSKDLQKKITEEILLGLKKQGFGEIRTLEFSLNIGFWCLPKNFNEQKNIGVSKTRVRFITNEDKRNGL